jgi:L-glyceraldehyde 3-phosphate reductase
VVAVVLQNMALTADEFAEIDQHATDEGINLWKRSSDQ